MMYTLRLYIYEGIHELAFKFFVFPVVYTRILTVQGVHLNYISCDVKDQKKETACNLSLDKKAIVQTQGRL